MKKEAYDYEKLNLREKEALEAARKRRVAIYGLPETATFSEIYKAEKDVVEKIGICCKDMNIEGERKFLAKKYSLSEDASWEEIMTKVKKILIKKYSLSEYATWQDISVVKFNELVSRYNIDESSISCPIEYVIDDARINYILKNFIEPLEYFIERYMLKASVTASNFDLCNRVCSYHRNIFENAYNKSYDEQRKYYENSQKEIVRMLEKLSIDEKRILHILCYYLRDNIDRDAFRIFIQTTIDILNEFFKKEGMDILTRNWFYEDLDITENMYQMSSLEQVIVNMNPHIKKRILGSYFIDEDVTWNEIYRRRLEKIKEKLPSFCKFVIKSTAERRSKKDIVVQREYVSIDVKSKTLTKKC